MNLGSLRVSSGARASCHHQHARCDYSPKPYRPMAMGPWGEVTGDAHESYLFHVYALVHDEIMGRQSVLCFFLCSYVHTVYTAASWRAA